MSAPGHPFGNPRQTQLGSRYWPAVHVVDSPGGLTPNAAWEAVQAGEISYDEWVAVLKAWQG